MMKKQSFEEMIMENLLRTESTTDLDIKHVMSWLFKVSLEKKGLKFDKQGNIVLPRS